MQKPSYLNFNHKGYFWKKDIDYRKYPELYRVGKGEQGVLLCEPYKSEIVGFWRFRTPEVAAKSSDKIYELFLEYLKNNDFVGADMARKFLQMGFTRSRRYCNYKGGRKYNKKEDYNLFEKGMGDPQKAISAQIFYDKWQLAEEHEVYKKLKQKWKEKYG
jgi:hypothetical protein